MFPNLNTYRGQPLAFGFWILWEIEHEACAESFASTVTVFPALKSCFCNLKTERGSHLLLVLGSCTEACAMASIAGSNHCKHHFSCIKQCFLQFEDREGAAARLWEHRYGFSWIKQVECCQWMEGDYMVYGVKVAARIIRGPWQLV